MGATGSKGFSFFPATSSWSSTTLTSSKQASSKRKHGSASRSRKPLGTTTNPGAAAVENDLDDTSNVGNGTTTQIAEATSDLHNGNSTSAPRSSPEQQPDNEWSPPAPTSSVVDAATATTTTTTTTLINANIGLPQAASGNAIPPPPTALLRPTASGTAHASMPSWIGKPDSMSFHESLVREHNNNFHFDDIYQVLEEIGQGGFCKIYKIQKRKDHKIAGVHKEGNRNNWAWVSRRRLRTNSSSRSTSYLFTLDRANTNNNNGHLKGRLKQQSEPPGRTFAQVPHPPTLVSTSKLAANMATIERSESEADGVESIGQPQYYALKVINLALVKEDKIGQLKNEVEILKTLDHKNIIKAYETFQFKSRRKLMIVMELCTGGDLYARIPYSERQAAKVTKQILNAVSYMHDRNFVHRDLKFTNIMFENDRPDAAIKVIDFGLSKAYSPPHNDVLNERVGTLQFMSPETMRGRQTSQADLWSIGVVTYMLLNGGLQPFDGRTPKQLVAKVLTGQYDLTGEVWDAVSEQGKQFIRQLLVVKPEDRMTARQAIYHEWLDCGSHHSPLDDDSIAIDEVFKDKVRQCIVRYASVGDFRKLALNVIAKKSTADDIFELRKVFEAWDTLNTGTLTLEELMDAMARESNYTEEEVKEIFHQLDVNRNNVINYTEFLAAALETKGTIEEYRLAEAFDQMDTDNAGYISRENLREILGRNSDEKYIDQLIAEADFKKDGRISYEEFLQVFNIKNQEQLYDIYEGANNSSRSTDEVLERFGIVSRVRNRVKSVKKRLDR